MFQRCGLITVMSRNKFPRNLNSTRKGFNSFQFNCLVYFLETFHSVLISEFFWLRGESSGSSAQFQYFCFDLLSFFGLVPHRSDGESVLTCSVLTVLLRLTAAFSINNCSFDIFVYS